MSAVVVFILFVICLVIAIPVSISLGIVAVLPGAFECRLCDSFHVRRNRQFPTACSADVRACRNFDGTRKDFTEVI